MSMCFIISRQSFRLCCKVVPWVCCRHIWASLVSSTNRWIREEFYWEGEQPHYWSSISFLCFYIFPNKGSNVCSIESWRDCLFLLFFPKESICLFYPSIFLIGSPTTWYISPISSTFCLCWRRSWKRFWNIWKKCNHAKQFFLHLLT